MAHLRTLGFLILVCICGAPALAQDGGDSTLEGGCDAGCGCAEVDDVERDGDPPPRPEPKISFQEQINRAIARGVAWLKKRQIKKGMIRPWDEKPYGSAYIGSWGPCKGDRKYGGGKPTAENYDSGPTSFAIYTLSKCDVKKKDPVIRRGLKWLRNYFRKTQVWNDAYRSTGATPKTNAPDTPAGHHMNTYEVASLIMMLETLHERSKKLTGRHAKRRVVSENPLRPPRGSKFPKDDWRWMHEGVRYLLKGKPGGGKSRGFPGCQNPQGGWRYGQANGDQDLSATQFVVLGLRAASQAGYPVEKMSPQAYRWAADFARTMQKGDGGFGYRQGMGNSAGMTACGLGVLIIAKEQLELVKQPIPSWMDGAIKKGIEHLDSVFDVNHNKGQHDGGSYLYYYLYAVERIGDLTGRKEFGGKDWYVRGARKLIAAQSPDGRWVDSTCMHPQDVLGTCFALLFLKRATPPAVTLSE